MSVPVEWSSYSRDQGLAQVGLETLQRQLLCPICVDVFTKPVVLLPCQHNLCRKCANQLYQPSLFQVGPGGRFRCPTCRHEVVLDRHGVYGLQRNLLVENIIDVYKQESASSRPEPSEPMLQPTCEEHEGEKLNIFCVTCQVPRCSLCKVFGAHKACQVKPLTEVYQQRKAELNEEVGCLTVSNERVQAFVSELQVTCRKVEENGETQRRAVCQKFQRMLAIMDERRRVMTRRITDEQEEKTGRMSALLRSHGETAENNTKLLGTAITAVEDSEMAVFVENSKQLIVRVKEASRGLVVESLEPGYDNMDHYQVNFTTAERALHQLDFIKEESEDDVEEEEEMVEEEEEMVEEEEEMVEEEEEMVEEEEEVPEESESEPEAEPQLEPVLDLESKLVLEPPPFPEPVALPVPSPRPDLEPEPVLEPVAAPLLVPDLETRRVAEPLRAVVPAVLESVNVLEPVDVLEPVNVLEPGDVLEPVDVREPVDVLELETVLELKTLGEGWEQEHQAEVRGQVEGCNADPLKAKIHNHEGLITYQAVTLFLFFLALALMFQRLWAHIKGLACI